MKSGSHGIKIPNTFSTEVSKTLKPLNLLPVGRSWPISYHFNLCRIHLDLTVSNDRAQEGDRWSVKFTFLSFQKRCSSNFIKTFADVRDMTINICRENKKYHQDIQTQTSTCLQVHLSIVLETPQVHWSNQKASPDTLVAAGSV